ncbi:MAG: hypothetical protein Q4D13_02435 [Erysipelotrichaceae bacterium]|nr:hypothetical protein [Erysipelotrichaceae bacterium]
MTDSKRQIFKNILLFLAVFLFLLLFSTRTSFLYKYNYGSDSATFRLIGLCLRNGKRLYTDVFDHKGPVMFLIQYLGTYLNGNALILIQTVFSFISLKLLLETGNLLNTSLSTLIFTLTVSSLYYLWTFQNGNYTEEYSMPFIVICLYLFIKYAVNVKNDIRHKYVYSFIYGICFAVIAFIRVNNAISIVAGVFAIMVYLFVHKEYKNLFMNLISGLSGVICISSLICLYFYLQGGLYDMLYATFIHNFMYLGITKDALTFSQRWLVLYTPLFSSVIMILYKVYKEKHFCFTDGILLSLVLFNLIMLLYANQYVHYFCIYVPVFTVVSMYCLNNRSLIAVILLLIVLYLYGYRSIRNMKQEYAKLKNGEHIALHKTINSTISTIPEEEKDSVLGLDVPSIYYLNGDILPCYRYFTSQTHWNDSNPQIAKDVLEYLNTSKPYWLITGKDNVNPVFQDIISKHYSLMSEDEYIRCYRYSN